MRPKALAGAALLAGTLAAGGAAAQGLEVLDGLDRKTRAEVERVLDRLDRPALPDQAQGRGPGGEGRGRDPDLPAASQGAAPPGRGVGRGRGRGTALIWPLSSEVTYEVTDPGADLATGETARFLVVASRSYTIEVAFPTWQPGPPAPALVRQAAFSRDAQHIGGQLFLDPTPDDPGNGDAIRQSADGSLTVLSLSRGLRIWGLGAEISPQFTDSPTGIAEAGTYSLEAEITLSPW
ncbi:hypothetical protein [Rhodosalinus sp.]|uniref:hypothetical protein n=1 Tax=Rhodosalinus sp. TaxID=2047741 RepID=UPI003563A146